jgi:hypothetical protein
LFTRVLFTRVRSTTPLLCVAANLNIYIVYPCTIHSCMFHNPAIMMRSCEPQYLYCIPTRVLFTHVCSTTPLLWCVAANVLFIIIHSITFMFAIHQIGTRSASSVVPISARNWNHRKVLGRGTSRYGTIEISAGLRYGGHYHQLDKSLFSPFVNRLHVCRTPDYTERKPKPVSCVRFTLLTVFRYISL